MLVYWNKQTISVPRRIRFPPGPPVKCIGALTRASAVLQSRRANTYRLGRLGSAAGRLGTVQAGTGIFPSPAGKLQQRSEDPDYITASGKIKALPAGWGGPTIIPRSLLTSPAATWERWLCNHEPRLDARPQLASAAGGPRRDRARHFPGAGLGDVVVVAANTTAAGSARTRRCRAIVSPSFSRTTYRGLLPLLRPTRRAPRADPAVRLLLADGLPPGRAAVPLDLFQPLAGAVIGVVAVIVGPRRRRRGQPAGGVGTAGAVPGQLGDVPRVVGRVPGSEHVPPEPGTAAPAHAGAHPGRRLRAPDVGAGPAGAPAPPPSGAVRPAHRGALCRQAPPGPGGHGARRRPA